MMQVTAGRDEPGYDRKRVHSLAITLLINFSHNRTYLLDIAITFFCQTKCCGTPVSSGDKLVIASPSDLKLLLAHFLPGYPQ